MKEKWIKRSKVDESIVKRLSDEINVSPLFAEILLQRGITSRESYEKKIELKNYESIDPFKIKNMDLCCKRINQAVESGEKILIYGDYDADGITSTALLYETLINIGADVNYYIPDRFKDGYGPNLITYQQIINDKITLLITVDNGVCGREEFSWARKKGVDVIVCDHHEIPAKVSSDIFCLIHPSLHDSNYPNKSLSGVGVAYKVACALLGGEQEELLDLVAIGTISDVVNLTTENRYFVLTGLKIIKTHNRIGLDYLLKETKIDSKTINDETIGYQIAPMINSAGRISQANFVVELLTTFDEEFALASAKKLGQLNKKRKEQSQIAYDEVVEEVQDINEQVIIVASDHWSEGIIGIVAAKISNKFNRPAIVFSIDKTKKIAKGSARTIGDVNLYELIDQRREMLLTFGGHAKAAGLSIDYKNMEKFKKSFQSVVIPQELLENKLIIDIETELKNLNFEFEQEIQRLRPFGLGNEEPVFSINHLSTLNVHQIGKNGSHLRLKLKQGDKQINAIGFDLGDYAHLFSTNNVEKIAFNLTLNNWNNLVQLQLKLLDFIETRPVIFDERMRKIKMSQLQKRNWPLVCFSEKHAKNLIQIHPEISHLIHLSTDSFSSERKVILLDQPPNESFLADFFHKNHHLTKIDVLMIDGLNLALGGFPSFKDFKESYKKIYKQKKIPLQNGIIDLGLSIEKTKVILNVFFDLDFITLKKGFVMINGEAKFCSLENSSVYLLYQDKYKFQKDFLLCSSEELKDKIKAYYKESREN